MTKTVLLTETGALRCQMWEPADDDDDGEAQCGNNARHAFRGAAPSYWIILACKEHYVYAIRCGKLTFPTSRRSDGLL